MAVALTIIGIVILFVFIIRCIIIFLFFRGVKKQTEKIEKLNADEEEKFQRRVKEQREAMEKFRRENFPD